MTSNKNYWSKLENANLNSHAKYILYVLKVQQQANVFDFKGKRKYTVIDYVTKNTNSHYIKTR